MTTTTREPKNTQRTKTPLGPDDLLVDFLTSRQESTPISAADARTRANTLTKNARIEDKKAGLIAHAQGSELNEFYMRHGDAVLGYATFRAFLKDRWPLDEDVAYARMRIAKLFTEEQCEDWGITVCKLGVKLLKETQAKDIATLCALDLPLPSDEGGGTVRFPAKATLLRAALRALKNPEVTNAETQTLGERVQRTRGHVRTLCDETPDYRTLEPRVWGADGEVVVSIRTVGARRMALGAEFLSKLSRKR